MNKVLKMDFRGQTAVLSAFVLVAMMFLVHAITEKALARVAAVAKGTCGPEGQTHPCEFTFMGKELKGPDASKVQWVNEPQCSKQSPSCTSFVWETKGACGGPTLTEFLSAKAGCDEEGTVQVKVGGGEASLYFLSPGRVGVPSSCEVRILDAGPGKLSGSCEKTDIPPNVVTMITYNLHSDTK